MNINSQYLWEKESSVDINPISIVLQQISVKKSKALLACVCESGRQNANAAMDSGYFTERLVEWFHQKFIKKFMLSMREAEITDALQEELNIITQELKRNNKNREERRMHYSGILICNNWCWMFQKGHTHIFLYNRRYNTKNKKKVILPDEEKVFEGRIQNNVGVLLCTETMTELFEDQELMEVFWGEHKVDEIHMRNRMYELWKVGASRNMNKVGMIYIWTY